MTKFDVVKNIECRDCHKFYKIEFNFEDWDKWQNGTQIQYAFPYLKSWEREMLKTRICDDCWKLF